MPTSQTRSPLAPIFGAVLQPIRAFFALEAASGLLLLGAAVSALAWVNLVDPVSYRALASLPIAVVAAGHAAEFTLLELVNDGLMALFFFVVGLEIKRELVLGELASPARAALPAVAAVGGMVVPALLYLAFNRGGPGQPGWGIPMATDIAFCIGVLTLLRRRVPHGLTVFVTALAIFDDIGGILVIALFYGTGLSWPWLGAALAATLGLAGLGRLGVRSGWAWAAAGGALWYALHHAGIHATIAGVVAGLAVPARTATSPRAVLRSLAGHMATLVATPVDEALDGQSVLAIEQGLEQVEPPLDRFLHGLHPWIAFGVMPAFALLNSGVEVRGMDPAALTGAVTVGTGTALVAGKLVGIFTFTALAVRLGLAPMPGQASHAKLLGAATVAGIGFTVALFIAGLAFPGHPEQLAQAKVGILAGSLVAGVLGALVLRLTPPVDTSEG